jgi:hypothetical protein
VKADHETALHAQGLTGMAQAGLVCLMIFTMLPILAIPGAWKENRGWRRAGAVAGCLLMYAVMGALMMGYLWLEGGLK